RRLERVVELALLADRLENGGAPVLELAQIAQAVLERAQLRIIERAGRLLAVARDERNRGAAVEQFHCGPDLLGAHDELVGDLLGDFLRDPLLLNGSGLRNGHAYTCTKGAGSEMASHAYRGRIWTRALRFFNPPSGKTLKCDVDQSLPAAACG